MTLPYSMRNHENVEALFTGRLAGTWLHSINYFVFYEVQNGHLFKDSVSGGGGIFDGG